MDTELTDFHQQKALGTMSLYCITSLSAVGCAHETMSLYFLTSLSAVGCAHEAMYCLTSLSVVGWPMKLCHYTVLPVSVL